MLSYGIHLVSMSFLLVYRIINADGVRLYLFMFYFVLYSLRMLLLLLIVLLLLLLCDREHCVAAVTSVRASFSLLFSLDVCAKESTIVAFKLKHIHRFIFNINGREDVFYFCKNKFAHELCSTVAIEESYGLDPRSFFCRSH